MVIGALVVMLTTLKPRHKDFIVNTPSCEELRTSILRACILQHTWGMITDSSGKTFKWTSLLDTSRLICWYINFEQSSACVWSAIVNSLLFSFKIKTVIRTHVNSLAKTRDFDLKSLFPQSFPLPNHLNQQKREMASTNKLLKRDVESMISLTLTEEFHRSFLLSAQTIDYSRSRCLSLLRFEIWNNLTLGLRMSFSALPVWTDDFFNLGSCFLILFLLSFLSLTARRELVLNACLTTSVKPLSGWAKMSELQ